MIPGSKGRHPSFKRGLLFALQGARQAFAQEANLRRMLVVAVLTMLTGLLYVKIVKSNRQDYVPFF